MSGGGAEKLLVNLVNNIDLNKYDIEIKLLFYQGVNLKNINSTIKVSYVFKKKILGFRVLSKLFSPKLLFRKFINSNYDVIISFYEGITTRIISGCTQEHVKLLNWVHISFDDFENQKKAYRSKRELVSCYKKYNKTICVANTVKDSFQRNIPEISSEKIQVVYNYMDIKTIIENSKESIDGKDFDNRNFTLITVGRFMPQKGYDRLIKIMSNLNKCLKETIVLYIYGSGEEKSLYEKLILEFNLQENIILKDYTDNPYQFMKNADLFICSSRKEGYSTVISEAILLETPVVATNCSGVREQLGNNKYGIITENNSEDLQRKLYSIISDPNAYRALKARMPEGAAMIKNRVDIKNYERLFDE